MASATVKAIISPNALRNMESYLKDKEYYAYLLFSLILETGIYQNVALSMTVADMIAACAHKSNEYIKGSDLSPDLLMCLSNACKGRPLAELFFVTKNGIPLTKDRMRTIFNQLSDLYPNDPVTSTALRKTFYWKQFLETADKPNQLMRRLQVSSLRELADFFGVPFSWVQIETVTHKKRKIITPDYVESITGHAVDLISQIRESCLDPCVTDDTLEEISGCLGALEIIIDKYADLFR